MIRRVTSMILRRGESASTVATEPKLSNMEMRPSTVPMRPKSGIAPETKSRWVPE